MTALERVLKQEKEVRQEISTSNKNILDKRIENYKSNENNVLDWEGVKNDW